jgi:hypothetical protein
MKVSRASVRPVLQSVIALFLGLFVVALVNAPAPALIDAVIPGSVGADGIPLTAPGQVLFLPLLFLAGMAGAFTVVIAAPGSPIIHAIVFGALAVAIDVAAVVEYARVWPVWFSALLVATVPPQVWLGAVLGLRARNRRARRASADAGPPVAAPHLQQHPPAPHLHRDQT